MRHAYRVVVGTDAEPAEFYYFLLAGNAETAARRGMRLYRHEVRNGDGLLGRPRVKSVEEKGTPE